MRHSNTDALYVPNSLKKNRARTLKSLSILEKMYLEDTNVFASNIIDKYKNRPDNLHSMCLADFASSYVSKKADDLSKEPDEIKSCTVPASSIDDVKLKIQTQSYEDRYKEVEGDILCNIKKHEPYLDIGYEELQNFNFVQSDEEEDNTEFSMINPNSLNLDVEDSGSVSNAPVMSTIIHNLLLPNEKVNRICSIL